MIETPLIPAAGNADATWIQDMLRDERRRARVRGKLEEDLTWLMEAFREVLRDLGEEALAAQLPWIGDEAGPGDALHERLPQALSISFQLLNMVEENVVAQTRRADEEEHGLGREPGCWGLVLSGLVRDGVPAEAIAERVAELVVEPVLTAHPTEAKRQTVLELHRELYLLLVKRENSIWTPSERDGIRAQVLDVLERLWRTGEIYLEKPGVTDELTTCCTTSGAYSPRRSRFLTTACIGPGARRGWTRRSWTIPTACRACVWATGSAETATDIPS